MFSLHFIHEDVQTLTMLYRLYAFHRSMKNLRNHKRFHLCTLENTADITDKCSVKKGTLCLSKFQEAFQIHWSPLNGTRIENVTAIMESVNLPDRNEWAPSAPFVVDCSKISLLTILDAPLSISILRKDSPMKRQFQLMKSDYRFLCQMIEPLLINGIAVPSSQEPHSFEFYGRPHKGFYTQIPMGIGLSRVNSYASLDVFWTEVHRMFTVLMKHLDLNNTLPKDPAFPMTAGALADHRMRMPRFSAGISTPVSIEEWKKNKQEESIRERLFAGGCDPEIIRELIPFVVGINAFSKKHLHDKWKAVSDEYRELLKAMNILTAQEKSANKELFEVFDLIERDVPRTDRTLAAFKDENSIAGKILSQVLHVFAYKNNWYIQGLNDIASAFILALVKKWSVDGTPLGKNGKATKIERVAPKVYWCLDNFLKHMNHAMLMRYPDNQIPMFSSRVYEIVDRLSPVAAIWLRRHGLDNLMWCYSSIIMLFKRDFVDIWQLWIRIACSASPGTWTIYLMAAVVMSLFDRIAIIPDITLTSLMNEFESMMHTLNISDLCQLSSWIYTKCRIEARRASALK